jgi:hypothetical protein
MAAVQFFGIDQVMKAAENLNCSAWGIFVGRNLFSKYEGTEMSESLAMLQQNLEMLSESGTTAIYTLKFFETQKGVTKINEKSVCDGGSFNFKLIEPQEREMMLLRNSSQYGVISGLEKKIEALQAQLAAQAEEVDEEEEEPETIGSFLIGLLKRPDELAQIITIGRALLGLPTQPIPQVATVNSIGSVPVDGTNKLDRLAAAIDILEKADPQLVEHLEKLAAMSQENPAQFNMLIGML